MAAASVHRLMPDAIGIGFRRCASSWAHSLLSRHPQIHKPQDGLHFFSNNFGNGIDWYAKHFEGLAGSKTSVEFSVSYTYPEHFAQVAERIHDCAPATKLFAILRDPVDRAFSDYLRSTRTLEIPASTSFEKAIADHPPFLARSQYGKLLNPYFALFPSDNIHIAFYEDLAADPVAFSQRLFTFLGVPDTVEALAVGQRTLPGRKVRSPILNRTLFGAKAIADMVLTRLSKQRWQAFKQRHLVAYTTLVAANSTPHKMSDDTRCRLKDYFSDDVALLARLLKTEVAPWM